MIKIELQTVYFGNSVRVLYVSGQSEHMSLKASATLRLTYLPQVGFIEIVSKSKHGSEKHIVHANWANVKHSEPKDQQNELDLSSSEKSTKRVNKENSELSAS